LSDTKVDIACLLASCTSIFANKDVIHHSRSLLILCVLPQIISYKERSYFSSRPRIQSATLTDVFLSPFSERAFKYVHVLRAVSDAVRGSEDHYMWRYSMISSQGTVEPSATNESRPHTCNAMRYAWCIPSAITNSIKRKTGCG
jgi:hypothetical protein